MAADQFKVFPE